jgi:superfamily II DNA helicase RecQ
VFVLIGVCGIWQRLQKADQAAVGNPQLSKVRQTMSERRRELQTQANNTQATPPISPVQPSAPPSTEDEIVQRVELIKKHLFSKTSDRPESVISIESIHKALQDRYDVNEDGKVITHSYMSTASSVRTLGRERECSICLDAYEEGDTICWAKRSHIPRRVCNRMA